MVKRKVELDIIQSVYSALSHRLLGSGDDFFHGNEKNVDFLLDLVTRTVEKGESNSLLILGPHGVGKTALGKEIFYLSTEILKCFNFLVKFKLFPLHYHFSAFPLRKFVFN